MTDRVVRPISIEALSSSTTPAPCLSPPCTRCFRSRPALTDVPFCSVQEKKRGVVPFPVDNLLSMPGHPDVPFLAVAIQCHTGTSSTSGHYRTLVRATATKGSEWVVYDDSRVRRMESVNVAKEEAYVLVYRQLDPRDLVRYNAPPP